ncbi:pyrroline-5-carboxylate reductase [Pseudorhizobium tarimense]|uniref:Pyrroline-5-carboxylate reductase n=1 Tax=Pseudorhizobium tarimense TaxID=1079109 RepID=A0ABV2H532_9HYPH|nr:pyrroline-5-carboxylate reductase [Pseudorhizobium tarimense]MCJ8518874.1 pyrroline-5-carboxylate reductase [Pseudorhizobium tarimense]
MIYGFIGTGTISAAMIEGMMASELDVTKVLVSPRNAEIAAGLAGRFSKVEVATSNQAVVDEAEILVLAVRPQVAEEVLSSLQVPSHRKIISVIAATEHSKLGSWMGCCESEIIRAIPLPFVADRSGVTAIYPGDSVASELFAALGEAVECRDQNEFDLLAVGSSMMGAYYGLMERVGGWLVEHGMDDRTASRYLTPLFASLSQVAVTSPGASYSGLRREFSTEGGLNEQVFREFEENGGSSALLKALDGVLERVRKG